VILTYSLRVRDRHTAELSRQARVVNLVWNYCNATQRKAAKERRRWLSDIDLNVLTAGTSKELNVSAKAIQQVAKQYVRSRKQHRRAWLRFRSHRKSLGWIPFPNQAIQLNHGKVRFNGRWYETQHWRAVPEGARLASGSFTADSRGRWYVNLVFEITSTQVYPHPNSRVGIDLGLKDLYQPLSDGTKFEAPRYYRATEERLAAAQRARKPSLVRTLSARIKNQRKDHAHKVSNSICKQYKDIYVGDVSPSEIIQKPRLAKSVSDAGWAMLREMLSYKSIREGGSTHVVDEKYSTQACAVCQALGGPAGVRELGIRVWTCGGCGTVLDRDTNAARNILRWGTPAPAEGIDCKGQSVHWMWMVIPAKCGRTSS